jgi:hypothetical protein
MLALQFLKYVPIETLGLFSAGRGGCMRLMLARALTVALAVLGGAGAMTFPKLVVAEAVPEAEAPTVAAPARPHVPVIRVAPFAPLQPAVIRLEAKPRPAEPQAPAVSGRSLVRTSVVAQAPRPVAVAPAPQAPTSPAPPHAAAPKPPPAPVPASPTPAPRAPTPTTAPDSVPEPAAEPVVRTVAAADEEPATKSKKPKKPKKAKKPKHAQAPPAVAAEPVPLVPAPAEAVAEVEEHEPNGNAYGHDKEKKEKEKDKGKGK